eukprot:5786564-Amphidinium_carterae.1
MVLPSSASPSLLRHTATTSLRFQPPNTATTVLRPESMVTLSKRNCLFASVAKLGSSRSSSAAYSRENPFCCTAAWTTS